MKTERPASDPRVAEGLRAVLAAADPVRSATPPDFLEAASRRGYFTPGEEEEIEVRYAQYLGIRAALMSTLGTLEDACSPSRGGWSAHLPAFAVAFAAACLLLRHGRALAAVAGAWPLLRKKLDEPCPRHGIPRKSFARVFRANTDPARLTEFRWAAEFYEKHRSKIAALAADPEFAPLIGLLDQDDDWLDRRRRDILRRRFAYRWFSFLRRHRSAWKQSVFGVLEWSGRAIAELRQPGVKPAGAPKRVTAAQRERLLRLVKPGDVFITRHDDALSNLFLPGFWPHAAFFIGDEAQRERLGVRVPPEIAARAGDPVLFLEARKDGVLFRPAEDTLAVDALVVLRPPLDGPLLAEALARAMHHEGKLFDFSFDFRNSDRLACTEVIYRTYHGTGPLAFSLVETGGRLCLPAEQLIAQALEQGFRVVAACGVGKDEIVTGTRAELALHGSRAAL